MLSIYYTSSKIKEFKIFSGSFLFLWGSPDQLRSCYKSLAILFAVLVCLQRFMSIAVLKLIVRIFKWPVIQYIRLAGSGVSFLPSREQITVLFFSTLPLRRNFNKLRLVLNKIFYTHLLLAVVGVDSIQFFSCHVFVQLRSIH